MPLAGVFRVAHGPLDGDTLVTVVGASGASASVTLGGVLSAGTRWGFSFATDGKVHRQPVFVVDGDASPARTVADVTQVVVVTPRAAAATPAPSASRTPGA